MVIKSKYNLGEKFYCIQNNRVLSLKILRIATDTTESPSNTNLRVKVTRTTYDLYENNGNHYGCVDEASADKTLFKTKEELFATL